MAKMVHTVGVPVPWRTNINGKETVELKKTSGGTRRITQVSTDGKRIVLDTRAKNGRTYYRGFEKGHQVRVNSFTVGLRSKYRSLGFRAGEKISVTERRFEGRVVSKTATAIREYGLSSHTRDLLTTPSLAGFFEHFLSRQLKSAGGVHEQ